MAAATPSAVSAFPSNALKALARRASADRKNRLLPVPSSRAAAATAATGRASSSEDSLAGSEPESVCGCGTTAAFTTSTSVERVARAAR